MTFFFIYIFLILIHNVWVLFLRQGAYAWRILLDHINYLTLSSFLSIHAWADSNLILFCNHLYFYTHTHIFFFCFGTRIFCIFFFAIFLKVFCLEHSIIINISYILLLLYLYLMMMVLEKCYKDTMRHRPHLREKWRQRQRISFNIHKRLPPFLWYSWIRIRFIQLRIVSCIL